MENKKISFGFSKIKKKADIFIASKNVEKPSVQLIDCLEGQSIKMKDHVEEEKKPLVIPIRSTRTAADIVQLAREKRLQAKTTTTTEQNQKEERPDSELSIDELAARELMREAQIRQNLITNNGATKVTELPLKPEEIKLEGAIESTTEDYEEVPISDYGKAMLRGMGWNEGMSIGRDPSKIVTKYDPELRPKGLGLGANKMVNAEKPKQALDKDGKELVLKKDSFAKVIAGSNKGNYCQVQGFDDDTSRIIVKTAVGGKILALNEFLVVPVAKEEYNLGSKVINNARYEEYKEISDVKLLKREIRSPDIKIKTEKRFSRSRSRSLNRKIKEENHHSDSEDKHRRKSKKSHKSKKSKKSKSRSSRRDSSPSSDEGYSKRKDKKKHKHNKR